MGGRALGVAMSHADVDGGTIDNCPIGGTTAAAGTFTTMTCTTAVVGGNTLSGTELGYVDSVTPGVVAASKAAVVDANKDIGDFRNLDAVNIDAGASGTAGTVDVFPSTASKGKLAITAADSAGDTTTTIVNASQAGARTYTVPDAGASASFVMTEGAQTVNGVKTFGSVPVLPTGGLTVGSTTLTEAELGVLDQANNATNVGAINATSGLACTITRNGALFTLTFTLTAVQLTVTDAAGSGSSASLKLFDMVESAWTVLGCRQDYTAFAEGAALTGGAGDAAFVLGVGTAAADAGDGALTGTEVDIGSVTSTITLSGGTGTGTQVSGSLGAFNGTATATDIYLNWSGTAATIDANSTIDVTGTIQIVGVLLGDD